MMQLCWAILWICCYSCSESTIIVRKPGENITLKCSSQGCFRSNEIDAWMYLYHNFTKHSEVYFYSTGPHGEISARSGYSGRTETNGTPTNHNVTIANLTVNDSGVYTCVYKESVEKSVNCNVYTVFVREVAPCPQRDGLHTSVLIITICALSMLLITAFLLLIIRRGKERRCYDTGAGSPTQESSVYEVMTKRDLCPVPVSESSSESPNEID